MPGSGVVRAAILQAKWTGDTASMIEVHETYAREAAQQGAKIMGFQEVFNAPVLLPGPGGRALPVGRARAGRADGHADAVAGPGDRDGARRAGVRDRERRQLLQHRRGDRRRRHGARQVPQAPHPAGQGVLGEVLLQARQPRLAGVRDRGRHHRRLHLLRPALPRGLAGAGAGRGADRVQPVGDEPRRCRRTCGSSSSRPPRWRTSTSSRAINRVGVEEYGDNDFYGTSYFVDPRGQFVGDVASSHDEELAGPRPGPRPDRRGAPDRGRSTATAGPTPTDRWCSRATRVGSDRRPAGPHPGRPAELARDLLRRADRDRARRRPARVGHRRASLPRLLRRHPHHDDRARAAGGDRRGSRAGREDPPLLDAVPQHADGGAGRGDRPGLGHPRRQGLLHDVGHRGERHGAAAGQLVPPQQPAPGDAQQLPRPVVLHGRDHREPELVTDLALAASRPTTCTAATASAARSRAWRTPSSSTRASGTCARSSTRRAATSRR